MSASINMRALLGKQERAQGQNVFFFFFFFFFFFSPKYHKLFTFKISQIFETRDFFNNTQPTPNLSSPQQTQQQQYQQYTKLNKIFLNIITKQQSTNAVGFVEQIALVIQYNQQDIHSSLVTKNISSQIIYVQFILHF
eukprot:TRINITY_DN5990_c0_g1_i2.p2 TRINITY_DN5990_c0_g1~~TRINITY_DN5990_c0_g1_i2.p2  ORF type:complete len:138 (-),score=6.61 TRINITY_DN5990_c0_g1_i2:395-808(-)